MSTTHLLPLTSYIPVSLLAWLAQLLTYHLSALLFELNDTYYQFLPSSLKVRKVDTSRPYSHLLRRVLLNQVFILLPAMLLCECLGLAFTNKNQTGSAHLSPARFFLSLPAMALGHDIVQYATHRFLLHAPNRWLMRLLKHGVHHSTAASRGVTACYMSAADFALEIVLPYLVPLVLVGGGGADVAWHCLVAGSGAVGGVYEHSGYDFSIPFLGEGESAPANVKDDPDQQAKEEDASSMLGFGIISSVSVLAGRILRAALDNRAHGEHHSRGSVSFSDGFGSPGVCDTWFGTRWDLVARKRKQAEVDEEWRRQRVVYAGNE